MIFYRIWTLKFINNTAYKTLLCFSEIMLPKDWPNVSDGVRKESRKRLHVRIKVLTDVNNISEMELNRSQ